MADVLASLERCGHLELSYPMRTDMLVMSASTMDRLLKSDRKALELKDRSTTKPGTLLKSQIPVRRGTEWSKDEAGFVEIDCVGSGRLFLPRWGCGRFPGLTSVRNTLLVWRTPYPLIP
jgi:hypothetical protein